MAYRLIFWKISQIRSFPMVIFVELFLCDYIQDKDYKTLKEAFVAICYIILY